MSLSTLDYLNLSAVAYLDFDKLSIGKNIAQLIKDEAIPKNDLNKKSELSALKNESNPLRSWKLIAQSPSSVSEVKVVNYRGYKRKEVVARSIPFSCTAFQNPETGEIIFSFKGTDFDLSGIKGYIEADNDISSADTQIALGMSLNLPTQFADAEKFVADISCA